ncbi:MAG TPA: hypothetical protein VMF69_26020 [Gemmataceae bacterium]|nr:hypothetical protein [Gemmataceae bacterium]
MAEAARKPSGWERALMAAEKVKERLRRATRALDAAGVAYAVAGGNAVAEWVGRIDEDAVRNTRVVDLLVRRADLPAVRAALEAAGFVYHHLLDIDTFIDGPQGKPSGGIHLLFAGEKVRGDDEHTLPDLDESERAVEFQVANLEAVVRMKLIAFRRKDQVHLLDLIGVGLLDATWPARLPPPLGDRLQQLLDDPNG